MVNAQDQIEKFKEFLETTYKKKIQRLTQKGKKSLIIDFLELTKYDHELSDQLLEEPEDTIKATEIALSQFDIKEPMRARFKNLPESQKRAIRDIRAEDLGEFIFFEGIVRQSSDVRPQVVNAKFECPSCGTTINIIQLEMKFREPSRCSCGRKAHFRLVKKDLVDGQRLVIEEAAEDLDGGAQPKRLSVFLKEDLVEPKMEKKTTPGTKVRVIGIISEVEIPLPAGGFKTVFDLVVNANNIEPVQEIFSDVEINQKDEEEIKNLSKDPKIFEKLTRSIAPSIMGHEKIKEALLLQLMGGVRKQKKDGTISRGDMHILLVGDPGAGKSALLTFIAKAAPKARYIAGKGASSAGLCVAPDSMVLTNPGKIYRIGSLVEEKLENNSERFNEEVTCAKNSASDKKIFTLDENLKLKPSLISQFWKIKTPKTMVRISTNSGKTLTTTQNTKVYTITKGEPYWKEAKFLKEGDYVATSRTLKFENENKQLTISLLKSNPTVYGVKKHVAEIIKILCLKYSVNKRELARSLNLNENKLYHHWVNEKARGNISLKDLIFLAEKAGYSLEEIAKDAKAFSLYKGHRIKLPVYLNEDILYFAGLIAGDGDLSKSKNAVCIRFSNNSKELQDWFSKASEQLFGVKTNTSSEHTKKRAESRRFSSKLVFELLNSLGIPESPKSSRINMSNTLLNLPNSYVAKFLRGYFDADGGPVERDKGSSCIECSTTSKTFAEKLQLVLLRFGIHSKLCNREPRPNEKIHSKHDKYILQIRGKTDMIRFRENIGFYITYKKQKLDRILGKIRVCRTNIDIIPGANHLLKEIKIKNHLTSKNICGYKTTNYFSGRFNLSKNNLKKIVFRLKNRNVQGLQQLETLANSDVFWEEIKKIEEITPVYDYVYDLTVEKSHNFLVNGFVVHNTASVVKDEFLKGWALEAGAMVLANKGICVLDELDKLSEEDTSALHEGMEQQSYHPDFQIMFSDGSVRSIGEFVDDLINSNKSRVVQGKDCEILPTEDYEVLTTDFNKTYPIRINRVSRHKAPDHFIEVKFSNGRKVTVTPEHPFFVYIGKDYQEVNAENLKINLLIPAPKEKNILVKEFPNSDLGLVLIKSIKKIKNKGIKWVYDVTVEPNHTFISEGLVLHNTITIAKANIQATLRAQTTILAAANPKLGRFDSYKPVSDQIEMPPTLINRFDLIFPIRDLPDKDKDSKIAQHVLEQHKEPEKLAPEISVELLRKYIAYVKQKVNPVLTEEAMQEIKSFYVNLRNMEKTGNEGVRPIPITPRQLEALIRFAEASARIRLSKNVTKADAKRAIDLLKYCMAQVGTDPDTGQVDIDFMHRGISSFKRNKILILFEIIDSAAEKGQKTIPKEELITELKLKGVTERQAEEIIEKLKREGELFEPKPGFIQKV